MTVFKQSCCYLIHRVNIQNRDSGTQLSVMFLKVKNILAKVSSLFSYYFTPEVYFNFYGYKMIELLRDTCRLLNHIVSDVFVIVIAVREIGTILDVPHEDS